MNIQETITHLWRYFLDITLPQGKERSFLSTATSRDFLDRASRAPRELPGINSLFDYRDPVVKAFVWQVKFKNDTGLAKLMAEIMYEALLSDLVEKSLFEGVDRPIVIPVPLHERRLKERGFNQMERVARCMATTDQNRNFTVGNMVHRIKDTKSQARTVNRAERQENMLDAFSVTQPSLVAGKDIVIIDDVTTTGSTIGEIKKVLMEAGARSALGFTFAH